jgi:hypothetical protein
LTIIGKWNSIKVDEFFNDFLIAIGNKLSWNWILSLNSIFIVKIGISYFKRIVAVNFQPVLTISKNDNYWTLVSKSSLSPGISVTSIMNGTDGVEFDFG